MNTLPFLDEDGVAALTGYRQKSRQIVQLRVMGIPFRVNATGRPIVACSAIDGVKQPVAGTEIPAWTPNVLKRA